MDKKEKALRFVEHIEKHIAFGDAELKPNAKVCCKICGMTIDEIAKEPRIRERRDVR